MTGEDDALTGGARGMGREEMIRQHRPELPTLEEISRYYALAEDARIYTDAGPCHERLALRLAAYVGDGVHCVPVANGTLGLLITLRDMCGEPEPGGRLIAVPALAPASSVAAIRWAGFEPLLVDIESDGWQLDPAALDEALTRHRAAVAGVLAVAPHGCVPCEETRSGWHAIALAHDLPLLIDSGGGLGATGATGRRAGGFGSVEVFSFHASTPFAIGEGGAVFTADLEQAERLSQLAGFGELGALDGLAGAKKSEPDESPGLNARMAELIAASGLAMLDRYDDLLARRRRTARELKDVFSEHPLTYQRGSESSTWPTFQLLLPDALLRDRAVEVAGRLNIEVGTGGGPLHRHPAFAQAPTSGGLEVSEMIGARSLSLPMANTLGPRQVVRLAELLQTVFDRAPRVA